MANNRTGVKKLVRRKNSARNVQPLSNVGRLLKNKSDKASSRKKRKSARGRHHNKSPNKRRIDSRLNVPSSRQPVRRRESSKGNWKRLATMTPLTTKKHGT
jgi:hypothetical protein